MNKSQKLRQQHRAGLLESQTSCPLCLRDFDETNPYGPLYACWDHCYKCRGFRGFVCRSCNTKIPGYWQREEPTGWKARVKAYLWSHNCNKPIFPSGRGSGSYTPAVA